MIVNWKSLTRTDCYEILYQMGGALRLMNEIEHALAVEKVANALYPGKIKPAPIVPRTTT